MTYRRLLAGGFAATCIGAAVGCASTYSDPASGQSAPDEPAIQVVGSATLEKPAELFRIQVNIVERSDDQVAALAAAAAKLDQITDGIENLEGLTSYKITSDEAATTVARPFGCDLGESYYSDDGERPEDCSPIEAGAILTFTLEATPAEAAGTAVAFIAEAGVENVNLTGFDVEDREAAELEVKQAALAEAISIAQALADQAGVDIGRPHTIRYGDEGRFAPIEMLQSERIVVTGSRLTRLPQVRLDLSPPPVSFFASVAATFEIR